MVAQITTGFGPHDLAFSDDNRYAFVSNARSGTVSIIDVRTLEKIKDVYTGNNPLSIAFSPLAQALYVTDRTDGTIVVIDADRHEIVARMEAHKGLGQIRFAPDGRLGFVVNPENDYLYILDSALNRIVQAGDLGEEPDQVSFSDELAYVRHRGSELVLMVSLDEAGQEGKQLQVIDFPGGQNPPGLMNWPTPAAGIVQAPGANAVLVSNAQDQAIYFYKEGMAAPMGHFNNYGRKPRAVQVVDRSLRQRSEPGVYESAARLRRPGLYDVVFYLDAPRFVYCFTVLVEADPEWAAEQAGIPQVVVESMVEEPNVSVGQRVRLGIRLGLDRAMGGEQEAQVERQRRPTVGGRVACLRMSGSLRASHTCSRDAWMRYSPLISMVGCLSHLGWPLDVEHNCRPATGQGGDGVTV